MSDQHALEKAKDDAKKAALALIDPNRKYGGKKCTSTVNQRLSAMKQTLKNKRQREGLSEQEERKLSIIHHALHTADAVADRVNPHTTAMKNELLAAQKKDKDELLAAMAPKAKKDREPHPTPRRNLIQSHPMRFPASSLQAPASRLPGRISSNLIR